VLGGWGEEEDQSLGFRKEHQINISLLNQWLHGIDKAESISDGFCVFYKSYFKTL
jgi:hypothetical protein